MNTTIYDTVFAKENMSYLGVSHGSDIPFVYDLVPEDKSATKAQKQLGRQMAASWSAFASSGNTTKGKTTVPGWTEGYQQGQNGYNVMVLGGKQPGMAAVGTSAQSVLSADRLVQRCAFWNSKSVLQQLQK